ncbi:uncharacterized protein EI90DRAFT_3156154 [Cantharellus anzutake]|uniref:uncharacterized protein n=1 Tax=Cantharellus anzutake TaxID=1750568 RepID=UPI001907B358|nr:uncharacterized protein EI90DRAFT_3156154 [Cantharellus anzutake]KAF8327368.1 hypothetical protein EI90DRAFT_3156154 [Cantharellus anzutake]
MIFTALLQLLLAYIGVIAAAPASPFEANQGLASLGNSLIANHNNGGAGPTLDAELWGHIHFIYQLIRPHPINVTEGVRVNIRFLGGTWRDTNGRLIAIVLPGIGGDEGYTDKAGVFHVDIRQTVRFVSDGRFGYVQLTGYKIGNYASTVVSIETDSAANLKFNNRIIYSLGTFSKTGVSAPIWALGPSAPPKINDEVVEK